MHYGRNGSGANMEELKSHYCEELSCIRRVFYPNLYCDKHVDNASNPNTMLERKVYKVHERYNGEIIYFNEFLKEYHAYVLENGRRPIMIPIKSQDLADLKKQIDDIHHPPKRRGRGKKA